MKNQQLGFTLIEIMISVAIVAIVAAIATPSYTSYMRRSYFSEVVSAAAAYKVGVSTCITRTNSLNVCNAGTNGIAPAITTPVGMVARVAVRAGVITATPVAQNGILTTDTYILTPTRDAASGNIVWTASGGGVTNGYAQ